ncbi:Copper-exporting P-type ATPase [Sinobacterium norvegicum]|uniref:Copper-exporting P-type ATPase n=1 Tax=Sinobacterium norvegicum TaxID=1641715 RepID=A0ABN8EPQ2_9GAMM|nr:heavy metal translocating P-type ATPase [Sinobacterium norvegicum]CAH0992948.1 Copper-exporting P-type ATPase [Sinobacterium norvegicum]
MTSAASKNRSTSSNIVNQYLISGPRCNSCVAKVEAAIAPLPNVSSVNFNLPQLTLTVTGPIADTEIFRAIEALDYSATKIHSVAEAESEKALQQHEQYLRHRNRGLAALALGLPLMAYGIIFDMSISHSQQQLGWGLVGLLTLAVLTLCGGHFFSSARSQFRQLSFGMDSLVAVGTGSAWLYSAVIVIAPAAFPPAARHVYFEAAAMIIGLINIGQALELKAKGATSQALKKLIGFQVKQAIVITSDGEQLTAFENINIGDLVRLRSGDKVAVDGIIHEGGGHVDESMLTGEPIPNYKAAGDSIFAGTLNTDGNIVYRASRVGRDTALARIIELVKSAQGSKLPIGKLADKIASVFVPVIFFIALISAVAWYAFGPEPTILYMLITAVTVLIIACPCALGLATPMSIMAGIGLAAEKGILIREGEALQKAASIDTVVLDKTGTITIGGPRLVDTVTVDGYNKSEVLAIAAALETGSSHPVAQALINAYQGRPLKAQQYVYYAGLGVQAELDGKRYLLGNLKLLSQQRIAQSTLFNNGEKLQQQGKTVIYLANHEAVLALFSFEDSLKTEATVIIRRLQQHGVTVIMASGDNSATCANVADKVGIEQYHGDFSPDDKQQLIGQLQAQGHRVAMVGDGINDAPALAQADVGYAIGDGTDIAIEAGDITLMGNSLTGILDATVISKATLRNIKQNLFGAFIYNIVGIPIAAGVLYPSLGLLLNPVVAGVAMSLSSITVVLNANRLRGLKIRH